ncbi:hypothetical protein BDA99DRAFT_534312 [Phascolomyces articulosus]|uniref:Uncharacterized protein n=1 Tax=Phascolomyces articulosus TaxID=60185 RepID=A0AAD5K6X0_9FUNG|nr:hypothetical protein BDA99DRAFT_534312 [Phascolomyces articulosus]
MTATTITTQQQHQHGGGQHKKCTSATCCSRSKIWKAIQTAIAMDDKKGLTLMFQDQERIPHIKTVLIKERNMNDASALPPSHKHRILQFDKTLRLEANSKFGKSVTDLNGLQVAMFQGREDIACQLLQFLRQQASLTELDSFLGHVWGKGNSSLHLACFHGMPRLVQLLLDMGADPHVMNACHFKPADCCKDPGCLALLEKATVSSFDLNEASANDDDGVHEENHQRVEEGDPGSSISTTTDGVSSSPSPTPTLRRGATGLLGLPTAKSPPHGVSLKRQASSAGGLNARGGSVEKKVKPGVLVSPTRSVQQRQPIKEAPKVPVVLSSLYDIDNNVRTWQQQQEMGSNDRVNRPPPVMRPSSALKPTPETERPVLVLPEKEEEDPPAASTQQQQQQQKQHQSVHSNAPTGTGDSVNHPHPPERLQQHSSSSQPAEANGQGSASPPPPNLSSLSSTLIRHDDIDDGGATTDVAAAAVADDGDDGGPSIATSPPFVVSTSFGRPYVKTSDSGMTVDDGEGGGGGTFSSSLTARLNSPWVPDKSNHLQLSDSPPPLSSLDLQHHHHPLHDEATKPIVTHKGSYLGVSATDHDYQEQHEQEKSERMKHQGNRMKSPTIKTTMTEQQQQQQSTITRLHPHQERVLTRTCSNALDPNDPTTNIALVFATEHLMSHVLSMIVTNKRIFDQVNAKQQQQEWNHYNNQEKSITFGATSTLSVDDDDDTNDGYQFRHLYQHHYYKTTRTSMTTTTTGQQELSCNRMGSMQPLLGGDHYSQGLIGQQQVVAVL